MILWKQRSLCALITLLFFALCSSPVIAAPSGDYILIDGFDYPTNEIARRNWSGTSPVVSQSKIKTIGKAALQLNCYFFKSLNRAYWDRNLSKPMDLSSYPYISIDVYCDGVMPVYRSLYFGVADKANQKKTVGYYAYMLRFPMKPGWNRFLMRKGDFVREGMVPEDGWKRINGVRVSFWGSKPGKSQIVVDNLYAAKVPFKCTFDLNKIKGVSAPSKLPILPYPQKCKLGGEPFVIGESVKVYMTADKPTGRVWKRVGGELSQLFSAELAKNVGLDLSQKCIAFGQIDSVRSMLAGIKASKHPAEGYYLLVKPTGVVLVANDERGLFYGLQTLKQLYDSRQGFVRGAEITDYPSLKMRGVYLHRIGKGQAALDKTKMLIKGLAAMKYNTIFIDIAATMKYKSQPFPFSGANAYSQEQMRELAEFARQNYIDLCPYYQMFMHVNWMAAEPRYRQLLENPKQLNWDSSWCPSNPETYKFACDILEEAIKVFKPKYIHVGHDEMQFSLLGTCTRCKNKSREDLIAMSMNTLCDFISSRGVKTLCWGDTLIPQFVGRAKFDLDYSRILKQLRPEMIVSTWYYGHDRKKLSEYVEPLLVRGFEVTVSPFKDDAGIVLSGKYASQKKMLGAIETLWHEWGTCGQFPNKVSNRAIALIGMSGNYFWNPNAPRLLFENYDWAYRTRKSFEPLYSMPKSPEGHLWQKLDISKQVNLNTKDPVAVKRLFAVESFINPKKTKVVGAGMSLPESAIVLRGNKADATYPEAVNIPVDQLADRVMFVHALSEPNDRKHWEQASTCTHKPVVGCYTIKWADGSEQRIELKYRWNIDTWNATAGIYQGRIAGQWKTSEGYLARLWTTSWKNPKPKLKIKGIQFSTTCTDAMNPMLFAVMLKKEK